MTTGFNKFLHLILSATLVACSFSSYAQYSQTVRGKILEQVLQRPLAGATITLANTARTTVSDHDGNFRITGVPVGAHQILITYTGFKEVLLENIVVNSGKEVVLTVSMEAELHSEKEVEVVGRNKKNKPLNDMSLVSARAFTVEETQKFAAAVNDPLRMATSFAGVVSADDGGNDIVIRGNSPMGLLWRMEGVDIPNPNHFSDAGSSGGGISILSTQLLANSDFVTGAFSAEYGNALSGVFDLKLRKGNNEKREYTIQAGLLGLNVAAEGPLMPFYKGSYLINYRYSTLQMLSKLGLDVAGGSVTNFQDISFNFYIPTAGIGEFTVFGFGGKSDQKNEIEKDSIKWETEGDRYGGKFLSNTSAIGMTHQIAAGENSQIKSAISVSNTNNSFFENYVQNDGSLLNSYQNTYKTNKIIISSQIQRRFSNRSNVRVGVIGNSIGYNFFNRSRENSSDPVTQKINATDKTYTAQAYAQWQYKPSDRLTLQSGLHYLHLFLNESRSAEPRFSARYSINQKNTISFGYGLHSQIQSLGIYFAEIENENGNKIRPNLDLDFTRSHHYVLSYAHAFNGSARIKGELYYQRLFDVPVSIYDSSSFSTINIQGDYITEPLANRGKGKNYGIDISWEKNLQNNFYLLVNHSLYRSLYTAADGIERSTRFNGSHVTNFTAGKEIVIDKGRKTIGINMKAIYAGGYRSTPIELEKSREQGHGVYREKEAFSVRNPAYFRTDIRVSMKWNRERLTSTVSLDVQNITNRLNLYNQYFDARNGEIKNNYQTGFIPVLNYKVEF